MRAVAKDTVIEEIRESRCQMSKACRNDPAGLVDYIRKMESRYIKQIRKYGRLRRSSRTTVAHAARDNVHTLNP